jgi:hypothetical protein
MERRTPIRHEAVEKTPNAQHPMNGSKITNWKFGVECPLTRQRSCVLNVYRQPADSEIGFRVFRGFKLHFPLCVPGGSAV